MHILIVGIPNSPLVAGAKIASDKGIAVSWVDSESQATNWKRFHGIVNVVMVDVGINIAELTARLAEESIKAPIIACGMTNDVRTAVAVVHAGAREYVSLLPDAEIIAAMLVAVSDGTNDLIDGDEAVALIVDVAEQVKPSGALVRRTIADVERDLILETLKHCLGNRTHAANILGISVRTLRNKLHDYAADGLFVPPPLRGDLRGVA